MASAIFREAFKNKLLEFLDYVLETVPQEYENNVIEYREAFSGAFTLMPKFIVKRLWENIKDYRNELKYRDEKFFLELDLDTHDNITENAKKDGLVFKELWLTMGDEEKHQYFKYFDVVFTLCEKAQE